MGDINCANCLEPWSSYHLRHDAIFDTDLNYPAAKIASEKGTPLNDIEVKGALERDGWKFGGSVLAVLHCPCCKSNEEENPDKSDIATRTLQYEILAEVLGDDEDGLQSMLEDLCE
jgi:hypothetical protein